MSEKIVLNSMNAILQKEIGGADTLYIGKTDVPIIQPNQILIEVHFAALNRADLLQREGKYPPPKGESVILGLEASGIIKEVGSDVIGLSQGDRVMALLAGGGQAEYVAVEQELVILLPQEISLQQAAAIPEVFLTAYQALFLESQTKEHATVLIHAGASGVGTAAIQLAKATHCQVITTSSESKLNICKNLGADLTINYQRQNFAEEVNTVTKGKGADIILDFIGAPYFKQNLECIALDGTLMMISVMGGFKLKEVNLYPILKKRVSIKGTTLRARSLDYKKTLIQLFIKEIMPLFKSKQVVPVIDSTFDWSNIKEAHLYMESNKNKGKIVLQIKE